MTGRSCRFCPCFQSRKETEKTTGEPSMLESIGNLLSILHTQQGRELRLEVGQRARLTTASGAFDISQTPLTQADIGGAVMPIIPDRVRTLLPTQPEIDFAYECSGLGTFGVKIRRQPTGLCV